MSGVDTETGNVEIPVHRAQGGTPCPRCASRATERLPVYWPRSQTPVLPFNYAPTRGRQQRGVPIGPPLLPRSPAGFGIILGVALAAIFAAVHGLAAVAALLVVPIMVSLLGNRHYRRELEEYRKAVTRWQRSSVCQACGLVYEDTTSIVDLDAPRPRSRNWLAEGLGWTLGILLLFVALSRLFDEPFDGVGLVLLVLAAMLLPPLRDPLGKPWNLGLSGRMRLAIAATALFVVLPIAGLIGISQQSATTAPAAVTAANAPAPPRAADPAPTVASNSVQNARLGETFRLGEFRYKITKAQTADRLGNEFVAEDAGRDATFVIVFYEITNEGNETAVGMADDFELVDGAQRRFRPLVPPA